MQILQTHKCHRFPVLLRAVHTMCKDATLPEPLKNDHLVNCPISEDYSIKPYNDYLRPFGGTVASHLNGNGELQEKISKVANPPTKKIKRYDPATFKIFV